MSSKIDNDEAVDGDYDDEDDDDEGEEFVPSPDDEYDNEDDAGETDSDDVDDEDAKPRLDGILSLDQSKKLRYQGDGFRFTSLEPMKMNFLDVNTRPESSAYIFQMEGDCAIIADARSSSTAAISAENKKLPGLRLIQVTLSSQGSDDSLLDDSIGKATKPTSKLKKCDDSDSDQDVRDQKESFREFRIYGKQLESTESDGMLLEFSGVFRPTVENANSASLISQIRFIPANNDTSTANSPNRATAAATGYKRKCDSEDYYDKDEDEVDYDELIALHEDAGLSVEAIRKRYQNGGGDEAGMGQPTKRKSTTEDEEEDDDIGF